MVALWRHGRLGEWGPGAGLVPPWRRRGPSSLRGTNRHPAAGIFVLDEIAKMESLSPAFVAAALLALTASVPLFRTILLMGGGLIAEAKSARR